MLFVENCTVCPILRLKMSFVCFSGYVYVGEQDPDPVFWQGGAEWQETPRHGEIPRCVCVFPLCVLSSYKSYCHASQHTFPQQNKQWCVSPLQCEWVVWWGFSAVSHSPRNALTLVCPSQRHTHTLTALTVTVTGWQVRVPVCHTGPSVQSVLDC